MRKQEETRLAEVAAEKAQFQAMMTQKEVVSVLAPQRLQLFYFYFGLMYL